jgi:hypothetical protein
MFRSFFSVSSNSVCSEKRFPSKRAVDHNKFVRPYLHCRKVASSQLRKANFRGQDTISGNVLNSIFQFLPRSFQEHNLLCWVIWKNEKFQKNQKRIPEQVERTRIDPWGKKDSNFRKLVRSHSKIRNNQSINLHRPRSTPKSMNKSINQSKKTIYCLLDVLGFHILDEFLVKLFKK